MSILISIVVVVSAVSGWVGFIIGIVVQANRCNKRGHNISKVFE